MLTGADVPEQKFTCTSKLLALSSRVSPMLTGAEAPKQEFTAKLPQPQCKEVEMVNYLLESYERVAAEERLAPKV